MGGTGEGRDEGDGVSPLPGEGGEVEQRGRAVEGWRGGGRTQEGPKWVARGARGS